MKRPVFTDIARSTDRSRAKQPVGLAFPITDRFGFVYLRTFVRQRFQFAPPKGVSGGQRSVGQSPAGQASLMRMGSSGRSSQRLSQGTFVPMRSMAKKTRPAVPPQPMPTGSRFGSTSSDGLKTWLPFICLCVITLFFAVRPIASDELWWNMSRGRAVAAGTWTPSRQLLSLETNAEADWLSGLPIWFLYTALGASGLMLMRVISMLLITTYLYHRGSHLSVTWRLLVPLLALSASDSLFDPSPMLMDLLGLVLLSAWLAVFQPNDSPERPAGKTASKATLRSSVELPATSVRPSDCDTSYGEDRVDSGWKRLLLVLLFVGWANLGQRVVLGWIALLPLLVMSASRAGTMPCVHHIKDTSRLRSWLKWFSPGRLPIGMQYLGLAMLASWITPCGWYTPWDGLRLLFPGLSAEPWVLAQTPWSLFSAEQWNLEACGLVWFSAFVPLALCYHSTHRRLPFFTVWIAAQAIAWTSRENMPLAAVWLALILLDARVTRYPSDRRQPDDSEATLRPRWKWLRLVPIPDSMGTMEKSAASQTISPHRYRTLLFLQPIQAAFWLTGTLLLVGAICVSYANLGWGIDARLDERYLRLALSFVQPHGTAFATEVRGAGLFCWVHAGKIQVQDVPRRALLGGRLREHQLLCSDLRQQRQHVYWREDATQGGWWLPIQERNTSLLLVTAEDTELLRALEPSIYKPLSLDSPIVPYAAAGDPAYANLLLEVLKQREFVELGPWRYQAADWMLSPFERLPGTASAQLAELIRIRRQAGVFRAMQLQRAALKVLTHALAEAPFSASRSAEFHAASVPRFSANHTMLMGFPLPLLGFASASESPLSSLLETPKGRIFGEIRKEFTACQADLAYQEWLRAGQASSFRLAAMQLFDRAQGKSVDQPENASWQQSAWMQQQAIRDDLAQAVTFYGQGNLEQARATLRHDDPESFYAAACLAVEQGQPETALSLLRTRPDSVTKVYLSILAQTLRMELESQNE